MQPNQVSIAFGTTYIDEVQSAQILVWKQSSQTMVFLYSKR